MSNDKMRFASALTFEHDADSITADISAQLGKGLGSSPPDLSLIFHTVHFAEEIEPILETLRSAYPDTLWIGCTGEGVIGTNREVEGKAAIATVSATLPGVEISPFSLMENDLNSVLADPGSLARVVDLRDGTRLILMLGDPFSVPMDHLLGAFNESFRGLPIIGGMASGTMAPGVGALILGRKVYRKGAVGVALSGNLQADIIVSQGCRPVGPVITVTEAEGNMICGLENETPVLLLQRLVDELSEEDRSLLKNGIFVGRAIDSGKEILGRGDFLIRGVMGIDKENGAIAVGDVIRTGESVQFHLRDADSAEEDLKMLLTPQSLFDDPSGAFLFSCNGRGTRLYDHPDGDVSAIDEFFHDLPLAGFFCAGEIGPVGGRNFLHGHTASLALIRPRSKETP